MNLILEHLTDDYAKQICSWKYDGVYSVYNYPKWDIIVKQKWAITVESKRKTEFLAVINEFQDLCGYIRFINNDDHVLIGIGLKPSLCGQGLGSKLMDLIKQEYKKRYNKTIILEVRSFNERAIKCYTKAGFKVVDTYEKDTLIGKGTFIKMMLKE